MIFVGIVLLGGFAIAVAVDLRDRKRPGAGGPGRIDPRLHPRVVHNQPHANPSTMFSGNGFS